MDRLYQVTMISSTLKAHQITANKMNSTDLKEQLEGNATEDATPSKTVTSCVVTEASAER